MKIYSRGVMVPQQTSELTSFANPRAKLTDRLNNHLKVALKEGVAGWCWYQIKSLPYRKSLIFNIARAINYGLIAVSWSILTKPVTYLLLNPLIFLRNPKKFINSTDSHHDLIIPRTANHPSFTLGAQPSELSITEVLAENQAKHIHVISMLAHKERVLIPQEETVISNEERSAIYIHGTIKHGVVDRLPWTDHGTLNLIVGPAQPQIKNQSVKAMIDLQQKLHRGFTANNIDTAFYCHCMAGKSRSFIETLSFLYFHPDKKTLFDFANWPKKIRDKIPLDLQERLQDNPSFSDLAEYVKLRRPKTKSLKKMESDQAGLLGLMTLAKMAKDGLRITYRGKIAEARLYNDAQNIGLMLKAPLDYGLRDLADRNAQEENLIKVYQAYHDHHPAINLLMAMIVPIGEKIKLPIDPPDTYTTDMENFTKRFTKLHPNEQARLAILLQKLEVAEPALDLGPLRGKSSEYAKIASKQVKNLAAGDQVELLRSFGATLDLDSSYGDVLKKIVTGSGIDRHNAGIQLSQLLQIAKINNKTTLCYQAMSSLSRSLSTKQIKILESLMQE